MGRNPTGSLKERQPGVWQISVTMGYDRASGNQKRLYRTVHGTKRNALAELQRMLVDFGKGTHIYSGQTLNDLIRAWMAQAELAETTRADYERVINAYLPHALARKRIDKIGPFDLDFAYRQLTQQGVSAHRIRKLHKVLRQSFAQAVRWQMVQRNPVVDATPPRIAKADIRPPSPDDVRKAIANAGPELAMWLRLAASTGARRGELCGARWGDVEGVPGLDPGARDSGDQPGWSRSSSRPSPSTRPAYLWIRRSVAYTPATGVIVKDTKTHQVRPVPLATATLSALNVYRESRLATGPGCYLFARDLQALEPWRPDSVSHAVAKAAEGKFGAHSLRHFAATQLIAAGIDPVTVSRILGHERTSTTMDMYAHWAEGTGQQAADHLASLLE